MSIIAIDSGRSWRRAALTAPASWVRMKRRLERPVSGSSKSSASSRSDCTTSSSWSTLVRPAASTRATSSASPIGSTRKSCAPPRSAATAASRSRSGRSSSTTARAVGLRVALERGQQRPPVVAAQLDVDEHDVGRLLAARVDGRVGVDERRDVVPDVREHAGEAREHPGIGMGEDDLHWVRDIPTGPWPLPRAAVHWGAHPSDFANQWCACGSSLKRSISS